MVLNPVNSRLASESCAPLASFLFYACIPCLKTRVLRDEKLKAKKRLCRTVKSAAQAFLISLFCLILTPIRRVSLPLQRLPD